MTLPTQAEIQTYARSVLAEQLIFAREAFKLPKMNPDLTFVDTKTAPWGQASETRKRTFRIKVSTYNLTRHELQGFKEYASYCHNSIIGSFATTDWKLFVSAVIAHELSHIVQFEIARVGFIHPDSDVNAKKLTIKGLGEYESGHGAFFRAIYCKMRKEFINHRIEPNSWFRKSFIIPDDFEDRMKAMGGTILDGQKVVIGNRPYTIVGRNPNRTRLFGFQVQGTDGRFYKVKLSQLVRSGNDKVRDLVLADDKLFKELLENEQAIRSKQNANARSSQTKRIRAARRRENA